MHQTRNLYIRQLAPQLEDLRFTCPHNGCPRRFPTKQGSIHHQRTIHNSILPVTLASMTEDEMRITLQDYSSDAGKNNGEDESSLSPNPRALL